VLDRRPALDGLDTALVMGLAVATTIGLATLSWRFFERPIVGWGHAFRY